MIELLNEFFGNANEIMKTHLMATSIIKKNYKFF